MSEATVRPLGVRQERLTVREALGERHFTTANFPLSVGGQGNAIVLAARSSGSPETEAWIGLHEDQLFVQPADGADVLYNGTPVRSSTWLKSGDVINLGMARLRYTQRADDRVLEVEDGSDGNITAPPAVDAGLRLKGESAGAADPIAAIPFKSGQKVVQRKRRSFTLGKAMLAVVGLIATVALWFIFTATSVGITADPATADISVQGTLPGIPLGERFLLRPGAYTVQAVQPGYSPARMQLEITDDPNQQYSMTLTKLPGRLNIAVPEQVQVTIDGKPAGAAPGEFELKPGKHAVAIASARFQPFTEDVEVEGGGKVQEYTPALVPAWAEVTVMSEPQGAQFVVDGEVRGITPLTTQVMAGSHPVELRMEGFKPWTTDILAKANEPMTVGPVRMGLPDGKLAVRSNPSGASVSIGGVYRGKTPLEIELRPDVSQSVVLSSPGYEAATRQVTLTPGQSQSLSVSLTGVYGEIAIRAQPADAQVLVDGVPKGNANQTLRLVAASHDIVIRKAGYVDFKTSVTPRPGLPQVVQTTLLTPQQSRMAAIPSSITTKAGQQLKLLPVGRFTMGSPRREPGRRANEAQREVEFKRPFYMSLKEVTNAEYRKFKASHRSGLVGSNSLDLDRQPVVNVGWNLAAQYCNWLSEQEGLPPAYKSDGSNMIAVEPMTTGYRLPTDAEWEWAARYAGAGGILRYPWGDALPVAAGSGNYADTTARIMVQNVVPNYDDGFAATAPVGKFPPNALGLYDMGGNVAEWAHDYYTVSMDSSKVAVDPLGPEKGNSHVIRGSSWRQSSVTELRLSARDFGDTARNDVGFRIARYGE